MSWYREQGPGGPVVLSTRVRLARNLSRYPFSGRMNPELYRNCCAEIQEALFSCHEKMQEQFRVLILADLSEPEIQNLVEKRLISEDLARAREYARVLVQKDERLSLLLGEEDHIRIQAVLPGFQLETAYQEAETVARALEEAADLAYSEEFGFLTACPTNVGTGMRVSVMLSLPALQEAGLLDRYFGALRQFGVVVRGAYGERSAAYGAVFQLSNQATLGLDEAQTLDAIRRAVDSLVQEEERVRQALWEQHPVEMMNRTFRAFGLLRHAYSLDLEEAHEALGKLRLGVSLGLFPALEPQMVHTLFCEIGDGALQCHAGKLLSKEDCARLRAKRFQEVLKQVEPVVQEKERT